MEALDACICNHQDYIEEPAKLLPIKVRHNLLNKKKVKITPHKLKGSQIPHILGSFTAVTK